MEVGTMVRRSYVWPKLVYGIICKIIEEKYMVEKSDFRDFVELRARVVWSDGTITEEITAELELMEDDLK
tara:strand:+ start:201 stop:410 length:210 start_codon:yes stop_codon:yes gene_type:complete